MSSEEKMGGYEASLTPRSAADRKYWEIYNEGRGEYQKERRQEELRLMQEILQKMNIPVLKQIFSQYLQEAGVPKENANFGPLERVFMGSQGSGASYFVSTNHVELYSGSEGFQEAVKLRKEGKSLPEDVALSFQRLLIHEFCHVLSRNRIRAKDTNNQRSLMTESSGYSSDTGMKRKSMRPEKRGSYKQISRKLEAFNEGVTERIAQEIFLKYGRKTGRAEEYRGYIEKHLRKKGSSFRYYVYGNQVDGVCALLSEKQGKEKAAVWKEIKRGYFRDPQEFLSASTQALGVGFWEEYGEIGNQTPLNEIAGFDSRYFGHPDDYLSTWLKDLDEPALERDQETEIE